MSETRLQLEASLNDLAAYLDDLEKDIPLTVLQAWHQTFTAKFQTRPLGLGMK